MVMSYVTGFTYKYKINGVFSRKLIPLRGLKQGDPLSSYLSILAMESLSFMFLEATVSDELSGLKVTPRTSAVTHLFFVDDIILFGKVREEEAYKVIRILNLFSKAFGQRINMKKYGLVFGKSIDRVKKQQFSCILSSQEWDSPSKYLGLPAQ